MISKNEIVVNRERNCINQYLAIMIINTISIEINDINNEDNGNEEIKLKWNIIDIKW